MDFGRISAAQAIAGSFGVIGGLGGAVHGVGEVLQGPVTPAGMFIASWTQGPIARYFDGDPAMTVVPNLLFAGTLTLLVSALIIVCACGYVRNRRGGAALIMLAVSLLLAGGGIGPPTFVLLAGIAGLGIDARYLWWHRHMHVRLRLLLARIWPPLFAVCLGNALFNLVGHVVAAYYFAPVNGAIFLYSFLLAVPLLLASIVTGIAYDLTRRDAVRSGHPEPANYR